MLYSMWNKLCKGKQTNKGLLKGYSAIDLLQKVLILEHRTLMILYYGHQSQNHQRIELI